MRNVESRIGYGVHQCNALLKHSLRHDAIAPRHACAGVPKDEPELFVQVAGPAKGVGRAVPEAVERQAATILHLEPSEVAAELAGELRNHLPASVALGFGEQTGLALLLHRVVILQE